MFSLFKKLGPGLLFAAAAIGVSHLVQSTKAGALFGTGLLWAMIVVHIFKYPTFLFGTRYTAITNQTLLHGYQTISNWVLIAYIVLTFGTMFTIQTAVTVVTAGIAQVLFGWSIPLEWWCLLLLGISALLLVLGKFSVLDKVIKIVVVCLSLSTIVALAISVQQTQRALALVHIFPKNAFEIGFLISFLGWMPAPLDVSVWQSMWMNEKRITTNKAISVKNAVFDFNLGYVGTLLIGICFLLMGAVLMHQSGENLSKSALGFATQFLQMYTISLGNFAYVIIGIAAFTCMFSTTITALDASPRALSLAFNLLGFKAKNSYTYILLLLVFGTLGILFFLLKEMALLVKIATIISFVTAPFYAIVNHILVFQKSKNHKPPHQILKVLSISGITFIIVFTIWYVIHLFS